MTPVGRDLLVTGAKLVAICDAGRRELPGGCGITGAGVRWVPATRPPRIDP
jgi:hypothetical protein